MGKCRSQTLQRIEAQTAEKGSRILLTAAKFGGTTIIQPVHKKSLSDELIDRAFNSELYRGPTEQGGSPDAKAGWRKTRPTTYATLPIPSHSVPKLSCVA